MATVPKTRNVLTTVEAAIVGLVRRMRGNPKTCPFGVATCCHDKDKMCDNCYRDWFM